MTLRILASFVLLFSVLFMPYWVSIILAFAGMVYFPVYAEAAILLLLSDLLYGVKEAKFFGIIFIAFMIAVALIFFVEFFKKKIKFYP